MNIQERISEKLAEIRVRTGILSLFSAWMLGATLGINPLLNPLSLEDTGPLELLFPFLALQLLLYDYYYR